MTPQRSVGFAIPSTSSSLIGADSCLGCAIVDREGTNIGELRDIMLDLSTGRIAYAVVELASSRATVVAHRHRRSLECGGCGSRRATAANQRACRLDRARPVRAARKRA